MVGAAGRGLVGAGGVLGLRPSGSRYALAVRATRSRFVHALTVWASPSPQLNEFIFVQMNS